MIQPYSNKFVHSIDHLPNLLQGLFLPAYLESDYTELLKFAESDLHDEVTPAMVEHFVQLICKQSKSREWFKYRARRITASRYGMKFKKRCFLKTLRSEVMASFAYCDNSRRHSSALELAFSTTEYFLIV